MKIRLRGFWDKFNLMPEPYQSTIIFWKKGTRNKIIIILAFSTLFLVLVLKNIDLFKRLISAFV